ncbi:MAG: hypothetical protein AB7O57_01200 [Hyphomicrobiaceae bacterium]
MIGMARSRMLHAVMLAAAVAAPLALPEPAGAAEELWRATLRLQLDDEKKCELQTWVSVRELPGEALGGIEGRVRCKDGREFDFTRQKAHQKFEIRLCQPAVC